MNRREVLGAMAALFAGVAVPALARELIVIPSWEAYGISQVKLTATDLDRMLKQVYMDPIMKNMFRDSALLQIFEDQQQIVATVSNPMPYFEVRQSITMDLVH